MSWWQKLPLGTKSVIAGAHCFIIHGWFVAWAWTRLFGFPFDPRLWIAFFCHDLGYIGKAHMDDADGETHPLMGARFMTDLFDTEARVDFDATTVRWNDKDFIWVDHEPFGKWGQLCLLHSRYYAKRLGRPVSRLCYADKLATILTPRWLYLPMVTLTGEIEEYMAGPRKRKPGLTPKEWHADMCAYMREWLDAHVGGAEDTWTERRHV